MSARQHPESGCVAVTHLSASSLIVVPLENKMTTLANEYTDQRSDSCPVPFDGVLHKGSQQQQKG